MWADHPSSMPPFKPKRLEQEGAAAGQLCRFVAPGPKLLANDLGAAGWRAALASCAIPRQLLADLQAQVCRQPAGAGGCASPAER